MEPDLEEKEYRKREQKRRSEMRKADDRILCRAVIWFQFHNPEMECHVPELQEKAATELIEACAAAQKLQWRQKRERIECGDPY